MAPPALVRVLEVRSRAMRVNLHISEPISASHSSLRSDNFGGLPLGQSHSGCSGVNKRNIDFFFHGKDYNFQHLKFYTESFWKGENKRIKRMFTRPHEGWKSNVISLRTAISLSRGANNSYQLTATDLKPDAALSRVDCSKYFFSISSAEMRFWSHFPFIFVMKKLFILHNPIIPVDAMIP